MKSFKAEQSIGQLEKRKGGYCHLVISADIVNQFKNKRLTRFICTIDKKLVFQCGLNHLGDGNFFIIIGSKNFKQLNKQIGDKVQFELKEDPNPLGVDMPEVLEALLEQDEALMAKFDNLTIGKKRSVIHALNKIKNIDLQIKNASRLIIDVQKPRRKKEL